MGKAGLLSLSTCSCFCLRNNFSKTQRRNDEKIEILSTKPQGVAQTLGAKTRKGQGKHRQGETNERHRTPTQQWHWRVLGPRRRLRALCLLCAGAQTCKRRLSDTLLACRSSRTASSVVLEGACHQIQSHACSAHRGDAPHKRGRRPCSGALPNPH
jgi:hypothetical protein